MIVLGRSIAVPVVLVVVRSVQQRPAMDQRAEFQTLLDAIRDGNTALVDRLVSDGARFENPGLDPALYVAAANGEVEIVETLLELDADANVRAGSNQSTPLMSTTYPRIAELLLAAGADPLAMDARGYTAIDFADSANRSSMLTLLAQAAAQAAQAPIAELWTREIPFSVDAFERAVLAGDAQAVTLFLDAGMRADQRPPDTNGHPILVTAARRVTPAILDLLLLGTPDLGADVLGRALVRAAWAAPLRSIDALLSWGADPNYLNGEMTPLFESISNPAQEIEVARHLLAKGADPDAPGGSDWMPPLAFLVLRADRFRDGDALERIQMLLDSGADVNVRVGTSGWTPLDRAHDDEPQIIEMLESAGGVRS